MKTPVVSVVVATQDRAEETAKCLLAIAQSARASRVPAEVVIVDDGSHDDTPAMLREMSRKWRGKLPLRIIRLPRSRGPAGARNAGVAATRAPLIAFTDSDCIPARGWLKALVSSARRNPEMVLLEGAVMPAGKRPGVYDHAVGNLRGGQGLTSNMGVKTADFRRLGGLDERFDKPHCREDTDFYFKVIERGLPYRFVPAARVFHPVKAGRPGAFLRDAKHGIHEPLLFFRHPRLYLTRLKWVDGWAFPAYYLGFYASAAVAAALWAGLFAPSRRIEGAIAGLAAASLIATVYARLRGGRRCSAREFVLLTLESLVVPFVRLWWVAVGCLRVAGIMLTGNLFRGKNSSLRH